MATDRGSGAECGLLGCWLVAPVGMAGGGWGRAEGS
jgi:hypothetical protein